MFKQRARIRDVAEKIPADGSKGLKPEFSDVQKTHFIIKPTWSLFIHWHLPEMEEEAENNARWFINTDIPDQVPENALGSKFTESMTISPPNHIPLF